MKINAASKLTMLLALGLVAPCVLALPNPFETYQPEVVVSDPYIEMHTGPGRGYPVFYVAGQGDKVRILKRRTDWFKIEIPRGSHDVRSGWVHVDQMRHTLDLDGNPIDIGEYGIEDFSHRRWEFGLGGGDFEGAATISAQLTFNLNPYIGLQIEASQILGDYSDGYMGNVGILMHPFPTWRISPFFTIGTGYLHVEPQTTIVQAEDQDDEIVHAGVGANFYISDKFILRMEYKRHTVLTSRNDNEELDQWKAGFSIFF